MRKDYVLSEAEVKILRKIVRIAIMEDNREKVRKIPVDAKLFNDQELTLAENFLK